MSPEETILETVRECRQCGGAGIYTGPSEVGGAAVVCDHCGGTGESDFENNEPFRGRRVLEGITRVFRTNPGAVLSGNIDMGGVSYPEWLEDPESVNRPGTEARDPFCPSQWTRRVRLTSLRVGDSPWGECQDYYFTGEFARCPFWARRHRCWERADREAREKAG